MNQAQPQSPSPSPGADPSPPQPRKGKGIRCAFDAFASIVTKWAGSPFAFTLAFIAVLAWACCGPIFRYSEDWQLVINTSTTIITFLMVFLIQQSQNKDSIAVHLKLDELLASQKGASNRLVDIENLDETQLRKMAEFYSRIAQQAGTGSRGRVMSIDDDGDVDAGSDTQIPELKAPYERG